MARQLRHEDPPQGREHFDLRAGIEWERGIDPNEIVPGSIADASRHMLKPGNRVIHSKGRWAVTDYGLEFLSRRPTKWERHQQWLEDMSKHWTALSEPSKRPPIDDNSFKVPAHELLDEVMGRHTGLRFYKLPIVVAFEPWVDLDMFEAFEECFYAAMPMHCRAPLAPTTFGDAISIQLLVEKYGRQAVQQRQPCLAEPDVMDRTFREARAIVAEVSLAAQTNSQQRKAAAQARKRHFASGPGCLLTCRSWEQRWGNRPAACG